LEFDLFTEGISDAEIADFCKRGHGFLITGTCLGDLAVVPIETLEMFKGVPSYTPSEVRYLLSLPQDEAQKVHKMKKYFGGNIKEIK
jgi:hypothetical protein